MEVSDCSSMPYSLSDIQLPDSPTSHVKPKDTKFEETERNQTDDHVSDEAINENSIPDSKNKSNGKTVLHKFNYSQEGDHSETKDSSYSNDSPEKIKVTKTKRHSDESSDIESDKNSSSYKKKTFKDKNKSSNLVVDSDNDQPNNTLSRKQRYLTAQSTTDESDNEKSSDSEKYKRRVDSKHKARSKRRDRDSRSSSSSSSRSSDSSPERRHSKKPTVTKSKEFIQDDESNHMSDKSSGETSPERRHSKKPTVTKSKEFIQDDESNHMSDKSSDEKSSSKRKHSKKPVITKSKEFIQDDESNHMSDKSSGETSQERRHSKKSTVTKSKEFIQDDESNHMSDKSSDEKSSSKRKHSKKPVITKNEDFIQDDESNHVSDKSSDETTPDRRQCKKTVVIKSKDFIQEDESSHMSDKSSDEKSVKHKKIKSATESPAVTTVTTKKRLKIKRDNVPLGILSPKTDAMETSTLNKGVEKSPSLPSVSEKPTKQDSNKEKEEPEVNYKPRKIVLSNRKLNRNSSEDNSTEPISKKSKWKSFFTSGHKTSHVAGVSISSLRDWFPDFKLVSETSMEVEQDEHSLPAIDEKNDLSQTDALKESESSIKKESKPQMDIEDSVLQEPDLDDTVELGPVSKIIFIQNLVRPFTLNQLKDLLKQSGKIVEEYFWIDKIKSKCFVMYETEKEAIKARNALNKNRWPSSNPKILSVEFSSLEELEKHKTGNEAPPIKPPEPPAIESSDILETRVSHTVEEHKRKDRERRKEKDRSKLQAPMREWDKDKIVQDSPERERPMREEKSRSAEKKEKKESKKKANEDTPAKLLDDLFQKTKSVPCIYWLPLTEEQVKAKDEEKKMRRLEREKRNQQLKEQEVSERRNRRARSSSRRREKESRKSSTRSRSPVSRRR